MRPCAMLGSRWDHLGPFWHAGPHAKPYWDIWGQVGAMVGQTGLFWGHVGACKGHVRLGSGDVGAMLHNVGGNEPPVG